MGIGLPVRTVCASNVIFARSKVSEHLAKPSDLAKKYWQVHQLILRHIQPVGILAIGKDTFDYLAKEGRLLSLPEEVSAGQGTPKCRAARVQLGALNVALVSVSHLGERLHYETERHPKAVSWVRDKLGL
jgi:hypothetical protein